MNKKELFLLNASFYATGSGNMGPTAVFPLRGKDPAISKENGGHGFYDATTDQPTITKWWNGKYAGCNIGIATGERNGIVVIDVDIDSEKGIDGSITLSMAEKELGELPETWTVNTPRGGQHLYFKYPDGQSISCGTNVFKDTHGDGIDYRGNGGYVVAPPSIHPDVNKQYEWDSALNPREIAIADLPEAWVNVLLKTEKKISEKFVLPDKVAEGSRNDTMFKLASSMRAKGVKATDIMEQMQRANKERFSPALGQDELNTIFNSAMGYTPNSEKNSHFQDVSEPLKLVCFSDVEYTAPKFIIDPYFPEGKLTIVQGDPSAGKTAFMCGITAKVTTGEPLLGIPVVQGNVLIFSTEDDTTVLMKRIQENGGDLSKCFTITDGSIPDFMDRRIEQAIQQTQAKLVLFDPLQSFLGAKIDMFRANETRPVLAHLADVAKKNACSISIISHMSKGQSKAMYKALGSIDIIGATRSALMIGYNPDKPDERAVVHFKSNTTRNGRTIAYTIGDYGKVIWQGFNDLDSDDLERAKVRKQAGISYEDEPLVSIIRQLVTENNGEIILSYDDLESLCVEKLHFIPFNGSNELRQKLSALSSEMMKKDGINLILPSGKNDRAKPFCWEGAIRSPKDTRATRCIRIYQMRYPSAYQTAVHS